MSEVSKYSEGSIFETSTSGKVKVIDYRNYKDILVSFVNSGVVVKTNGDRLKKGNIKDPSVPTVYGVGCIGKGEEKTSVRNKTYSTWRNMLRRCYSPSGTNRDATYKDCYVCEEWLNFQTFAKWYHNNKKGEGFHLDKDILGDGKIYSPSTCEFIPAKLNTIFGENTAQRGKYPKGVSYDKERKLFAAYCNVDGKISHKY